MAITLTGLVTNKGRELLAKSLGNIGGFPLVRAAKFRIGEGGFISTASGKIPKTPSPTLTNIEATGAPGDFYVEKNFAASDITFIAPSTIELRCKLDPSEANDDLAGNPPKFFELGIFDDNNNMLVYTTFDEQTKTPTKSLIAFVQVFF